MGKERKRSEHIEPSELDEALMVVVVHRNGTYKVDADNDNPVICGTILHAIAHSMLDGNVVQIGDDTLDDIERFANGEPNE